MNRYTPGHTCTGCDATITGTHAIRDGDRYCTDCKTVPAAEVDVDVDPPATIAEYNAWRGVALDVGDIMDGGDPL